MRIPSARELAADTVVHVLGLVLGIVGVATLLVFVLVGPASWQAVPVGIYAACLIGAFGAFVPVVHLVPYAVDHGVTQPLAVLLLAAIGVGSTAGRFFLGGLADRMGRARALVAMIAGMAAALAIWGFASGFWLLALFAFAYGVFYGGWVAILPAVVMDYFGGRNVSGIIGILYTSVAFGTLVGPSAAGFAFDVSHSYMLPIIASVCANMIAAAIIAAMPKEGG